MNQLKKGRKTLLTTSIAMAMAMAATHQVVAQSANTITLSDGTEECVAELESLSIEPGTGNVIATVTSLEDCGSDGTPTIGSFTVDGELNTTVDEGTDVTVAWSSSNTTACTAGGTLPGWQQQGTLAPTGSVAVTTTNLPNNDYTLTLLCNGPAGQEVANPPRVVTVQNSTSANDCAVRPPPPGVQRAADIVVNRISNAFLFSSVFNGEFPGSQNSQQIALLTGQYAAMEFSTPTVTPNTEGSVEVNILQPNPNDTETGNVPRLWSISRCPGDFRAHILDDEMGPGCVSQGTVNLRFGGVTKKNDPGVCALEANTTYFLNVLYTGQLRPQSNAEHDALQSQCPETRCGHLVRPNGFGFGN